ncbi:uncharacterized protein K441DRAFT_694765 [Cenococcum geophilum 1.58]|uniref:uncharacterized protein n=1 Tax=Cenococcum geophilum 1.58 TaxID=794803 RepID=UPI00358F55A4|nr:hypothetical protein K441DRAFT_694765 [Cenococcum geophilum 1.58]
MTHRKAAFQDNSQNTDQQPAKQSRSPNCLKRTFDPDESVVSRPRKRRAEAPIELSTNSKTPGSTGLNLIERTNALPPSKFRSRFLPSGSPLLPFASNKAAPNTTPAFTLDIELEASCDLSESDFNACFKLIEETSSQAYRDSRKGWRPKAKRKEMQDPDMRYLLVRKHLSPQPPVESDDGPYLAPGFLSFMITLDDDYEYPVLYIYEIHLSSELRSCGLGAHLIQIAEYIGRGVGVTKTMLTVFTSNTAAERFYRRLEYSQDEISPEPRILRNGLVKPVDYMIMSKLLEDRGQLQ